MELICRICWVALALLHLPPAAVLFAPGLLERLYGTGTGTHADAMLLLVHRGALFLAVVAVACLALFDEGARRAASLVVLISLLGFLAVYLRAGAPAGALRKIAWADLVGLAPLAWVTWDAWLRVNG